MRIVNCTTAAQYFHVLRRQALLLDTDPLPLVVMTPKSLLRHPLTASTPAELAEGRFQTVIDDAAGGGAAPAKVRRARALQRQGRVDLADAASSAQGQPERRARPRRAALSVPGRRRFASASTRYPKLREVCWVQEEPENMGAWEFVRPLLEQLDRRPAGRCATSAASRNSSPSEGSAAGTPPTSARSSSRSSKRRPRRRSSIGVLSKQV